MPKKQTITFVDDVQVFDHNGELEFEAFAGDTVELSESSADRWLRRGKAIVGDASAKALIKASAELDKAQQRLDQANSQEDTKEVELAEKYYARKKAAYDALVEKAETADSDAG